MPDDTVETASQRQGPPFLDSIPFVRDHADSPTAWANPSELRLPEDASSNSAVSKCCRAHVRTHPLGPAISVAFWGPLPNDCRFSAVKSHLHIIARAHYAPVLCSIDTDRTLALPVRGSPQAMHSTACSSLSMHVFMPTTRDDSMPLTDHGRYYGSAPCAANEPPSAGNGIMLRTCGVAHK